jgi:hypothetical protein
MSLGRTFYWGRLEATSVNKHYNAEDLLVQVLIGVGGGGESLKGLLYYAHSACMRSLSGQWW